jgi:hypothetical protein
MQTFGPEVVAKYVNVSDYLTRRGTALGIDTKGLVKSEEELAAEQQQAQEAIMNQMLAEGGMGMAQEMVKGAMRQ